MRYYRHPPAFFFKKYFRIFCRVYFNHIASIPELLPTSCSFLFLKRGLGEGGIDTQKVNLSPKGSKQTNKNNKTTESILCWGLP